MASNSLGPEITSAGVDGHGAGNDTMQIKQCLIQASSNGDVQIIKEIWRSYGDSYVWDVLKDAREEGMTPLHRAVIAQHKDIVDALIPIGCDPGGSNIAFDFLHARTREGWTAIHLAVLSENETILDVLISKYDSCTKPRTTAWDFADLWWMTPLHYAVLGNKDAQMKKLLNWEGYNPHVNARDYFQRTPLHLASCHRPVSVEDLLKHPMVDINAKDSFMQTPFHWAVCFGRVDVVRRLVMIVLDSAARAVQVTHRDLDGRSVLEIAIQDILLDPIPSVLEHLSSVPAEYDVWAFKDAYTQLNHKEVNAEIEKLLRLCPDVKEEAKTLQTNLAINVTVLTSYLLVAGWIASSTFNKTLTLSDRRVLNYFTIVIHALLFCSSGITLLSCAKTLRFLAKSVHIGQRSLFVRTAVSLIGRMILHVAVWCVAAFVCDNIANIVSTSGSRSQSGSEITKVQKEISYTLRGLILALALSVAVGLLLYLSVAINIESLSQQELIFLTGRSLDTGDKGIIDTVFRYLNYFVESLRIRFRSHRSPATPEKSFLGRRSASFSKIREQEEVGNSEDRENLVKDVLNKWNETAAETIFAQPAAQQSNDFARDYWKQKKVPPKILKQFEDIQHEVSRLETVYRKLSEDIAADDHHVGKVKKARHNVLHLDRLPQGLFYWARYSRWLQLPTMSEPIMFPYRILKMEFSDPSKPLSVFFRGYVFGRDITLFREISKIYKKNEMGESTREPAN